MKHCMQTKRFQHILLCILLPISIQLNAQEKYQGMLLDSSTHQPISDALIEDTASKNTTFSDVDGKFDIMAYGDLKISSLYYEEKFLKKKEEWQEIIYLIKINDLILDEVFLHQQTIPVLLKNSVDAVSILNTNEINTGNTTDLSPILNKVPGVFMQSGALNTNRITIRGIGARNLFGTADIRTYFDEIPLTDGNGESAIEDLELASIATIQIHKGPSSSSYGVGLGGAIILKPKRVEKEGVSTIFDASLGSYGYYKNVFQSSLKKGKFQTNLTISSVQSNGYRKNNTYDRKTITSTSFLEINHRNHLSLLGSHVQLLAEIPSSLSFQNYLENPREAAFTWGRSKANEDLDYSLLGISWKHIFSEKWYQKTNIFGSFRHNDEDRPFNILEENATILGIRSRILGSWTKNKQKLQWTAGGELFLDFYTTKTFENLYEEFPQQRGSVQGNLLSEFDENRNYYNFFTEINYEINPNFKINAGLHFNQTFFRVEDQFLANDDKSLLKFNFDPILSPRIGINYALFKNFTIFGNIAKGFSTPTTNETLQPEGDFNPDLRPEIGWNYEVGSRFQFWNERITGSFSAYLMSVEDLLVARRTQEDAFFAVNAGKTKHNGLEAEVSYTIKKMKYGNLSLFFNSSIYDYRFDEFIDLDDNFSGERITGTPSYVHNLGINLTTTQKFFGNINYQRVGKIPVNDANTLFNESYGLVNAKAGYYFKVHQRFIIKLYFGINNAFNEKYASQIQVNATSFGGNPPRYFYPGLPANYYGGININYKL